MALQLDMAALTNAIDAAANGAAPPTDPNAGSYDMAPDPNLPAIDLPDIATVVAQESASSAGDAGPSAPPATPPAPPAPSPADPALGGFDPTVQPSPTAPAGDMPWNTPDATFTQPAAVEPGVSVPPVAPAADAPPAATTGGAPSPTPAATPTEQQQLDLARLYQVALGREPTADEVIQTISLSTRLGALPESTRGWVDAMISGRLTPEQIEAEIERARAMAQAPAPAPVPAPAQQYARPGEDDYDPFNPVPAPPATDPRLEWERQQFAAQRAEFERQQAEFMNRERAQARAGAEAAFSDLPSRYPTLTLEEIAVVKEQAIHENLFGALYNQSKDARAAMNQTLDHVMLNNPLLRGHVLGQTTTQPTPDEVARANAASALSGGGGGAAGPMGPTAPPRPTNPAALQQVAIPQDVRGPATPPVQPPVQPGMSPLAPPAPTPAPSTDRNSQTLAMAQMIANITGQAQE